MVEINNQRKAFLDVMLAWSEGTDNGRQKTRNHGYDVIVAAESYLLITWSPSHRSSNQNSNQQAPDATSLFSCWWMPTASSLAWKTFSEKSGRCGIAAD